MHVIGRGRYARETYPEAPRGGGSGSALAKAFTTGDFSGNLNSVTPGTIPGSPILAFNLTPTASGLIVCEADLLANFDGSDTMAFDGVLVDNATATGGFSLGTNVLGGNDANPLTIPAGGVINAHFQEPPNIASAQQRSMTLAFHVNATVGQPCCVVIYAYSTSPFNDWFMSVNASALEQPN
jgi:hypothetical protein